MMDDQHETYLPSRQTPRAILGDLLVLELGSKTLDLDSVLLNEGVRVFDDLFLGSGELHGFETSSKVECRVGFGHPVSMERSMMV